MGRRTDGTLIVWGDNAFHETVVPALPAGVQAVEIAAADFYDVMTFDPNPVVVAYCSGDGSATACPCANSGIAEHGCANSVNSSGAALSGAGGASLSNDTLVLAGSGMPNASALYFQGTTRQNGGAGNVFGDGLRCAGGTIVRLGDEEQRERQLAVSARAATADLGARRQSRSPGMRTYQVWYRNAAAFCTPSTFNLTNGIEVAWGM